MGRLPLEIPQLAWSREVVERQVVHLTRLVDDLLDVSRITRGIINLSREPVSIQTVVTRAVETLQPAITHHRHELSVAVTEEPLEVLGDLTRLTQMVGNLLSNAAKYTNPGGHIALTVERRNDEVRISVKDDGIGIAREAMPRLFTLFSQLQVDNARMQGGLGIGLALVQRLAGMHGGRVEALSEGLDRGSTFTVILPLTQIEADPMSPAQEDNIPTEAARRRILVADDNIDALDSLAMLLEFAGHEVQKARDGAEALESARAWHPGHHAAGPRHAEAHRLRGRAARARRGVGAAREAGRHQRLGPERGPAPIARVRIRPAPGEADQLRVPQRNPERTDLLTVPSSGLASEHLQASWMPTSTPSRRWRS